MIIAAIDLPTWLPLAFVGATCTVLALLKVCGLSCGVVGGRDKPLFQCAIGTCPTWVGRGWKGLSLRVGPAIAVPGHRPMEPRRADLADFFMTHPH